MAWSSSSFVPLTRSRTTIVAKNYGILGRSSVAKRSASSSSVSLLTKRSQMVMWGEEDAPKRDVAIPSSQFSTDSDDRRPVRPVRRSATRPSDNQSSNSGGGDGWFDDADDPSYKRSPNTYKKGPTARRGEPSRSSGGGGGGGGWDDDNSRRPTARRGETGRSNGWDDGESSVGGYEPYEYDKKPSSNRGRGSRGRDGGGGRGGRGGRGRDRGDSFRRDDSFSSSSRGGRGRGRDNDSFSSSRGGRGRGDRDGRGRGGRGGDINRKEVDADGAIKTNLRMIENAGLQHLYGIAPVLNALKANVRNFESADEKEDGKVNKEDLMELQDRLSNVDGIDNDGSSSFDDNYAQQSNDEIKKKKIIKPEAKLSPHLFIQEGHTALDNNKRSFRSNAKVEASAEILTLAQEKEVPIVEVDKGVLNTLCGNRPHQGFVLRCGGLDFEPVRKLPTAGDTGGPKLWLALDEVVDPQNLGALLRSAYFLGRGQGIISDDSDLDAAIAGGGVGILVCSKNSSPLTPTVSAASAGALEFMTIYSTSNLPKLLNGAKEDGWRILGAAAEVPDGVQNRGISSGAAGGSSLPSKNASANNDWDLESEDDAEDESEVVVADDNNIDNTEQQQQQHQQCLDLHKIETGESLPTILVLGSEGRGLRTLVARACTGFVSVPGGGVGGIEDEDVSSETQSGVDSLNVSVTGGILLWHFLSKL